MENEIFHIGSERSHVARAQAARVIIARSLVESLGGDAASRVWAGDWTELEPGLQG